MVATWLCEIYLDKLNNLKNVDDKDKHEALEDEFCQFLKDYKVPGKGVSLSVERIIWIELQPSI
jgi:hypothetical protein